MGDFGSFPYGERVGGWSLPAGERVMFFPLARWPHCYSSKGEMVMVFPLGTLAFGYSLLGKMAD